MAGNRKIVLHFIEVSTLGFIPDMSDFTKALQIPMMPDNLKRSIVSAIVSAALKSAFSIYCNCNSNNAAIDVTVPRTWFIRSLYYNCLSIL